MSKPLVLTFDCGTQSTRAMLFDAEGRLVAIKKIVYDKPYFSLKEGWAEQHIETYWQSFIQASQALKAAEPALWTDINAVAVTTIRDVAILLDAELQPLRACISWLDKRKAKANCADLPAKTRFVCAIGNMVDTVDMNMADCKSNWIIENEPDLWANTHEYVQFCTYLNYLLTGKLVDSLGSMIGHFPFDYKKKQWMPDTHYKAPIFNIPNAMLYDFVEPGEKIGTITAYAAELTGIPEGTPLISAGSDKGCETLGTGAVDKHTASLSFGTTATVQVTTQKYVEPFSFLPAYPGIYPNSYNPEVQIFRGYWTVKWFLENFAYEECALAKAQGIAPEKILDEKILDIEPGSNGLIVSPFWSAGLKYPEAKGAMIGFSDVHTKYHIYRAILEGINFALMDGLKRLERKGKMDIKTLTISGGGAGSDIVCQLTADMFGIPVKRAQTYETSGLGAAICAFVGLGTYKDFDAAIQNMVHHGTAFEPNGEITKKYHEIYINVYRHHYRKIRSIYKAMKCLKA